MFGPWFNIAGSCVPYSMLVTALYFEKRRQIDVSNRPEESGDRPNFFPVLSVLLAIALLFGEKADLHGFKGAALIAFVLIGATLVAVRQQGVRYEVLGLQRAVARREAEVRLTELVRQSSDLIVVVDPLGCLSFVSPASLKVLGLSPQLLKGTPAVQILGPENERRLRSFLGDIAQRRSAPADIEAVFAAPDGARRTVHIVGSDQLDNPAIGGIALTIRDLTDQRGLEREVLDVASRERERLASDIHDGLGQELTGIALLLKSLDMPLEKQRGTLERSMHMIEGHIENTIELARKLASGFSPLQIGGGSLDAVLARLAEQAGERFSFKVNFRHRLAHCVVGASELEHLYRIAQESLTNAARHSNCRSVELELISADGVLELIIADDEIGRAHV